MDAIISGSAAVAVIVEGESLWSLRRIAAGVERRQHGCHELRYVFGDARDLTFLEDVDEASVLAELDTANGGVKAIHLALMLCDRETSERAACLAADEIDVLLRSDAVAERVARILDARPMGGHAARSLAPSAPAQPPLEPGIAATRCRAHLRARAATFFNALSQRQSAIADVRRAWDVLPASLFDGGAERALADSLLAREGLFRSLVHAHITGARMDAWLDEARRHPALREGAVVRWVEAWVESLRHLAVVSEPTPMPELRVPVRGASRIEGPIQVAPSWLRPLPNMSNFFFDVRHLLTTPIDHRRSAIDGRSPAIR